MSHDSFFLIHVLDFYHGSLLNYLNHQTCTHEISLARWRQHAGKLAYKQPHLKYMMIKWMIPRQGWTWYNMILCNALDVDTNFNPLNLDVGYCWIIKKCFSKTPSFRPRCIKTSRSPERSVELMEMEVYSLSWKARKNWLTTWFFHVFPIYIRARRDTPSLWFSLQ